MGARAESRLGLCGGGCRPPRGDRHVAGSGDPVGCWPQRVRAGGGVQSDGRGDRRVVRMDQHQCDPCGHWCHPEPFGPPVNVSAASQDATNPQLAIASSVTVAVWEQQNSANSFSVQAAASPAAKRALAAAGEPLCVRPERHRGAGGGEFTAGDAVAVSERTSNPDIIEAASRPATSGIWQAPHDISLPSHPAVPRCARRILKELRRAGPDRRWPGPPVRWRDHSADLLRHHRDACTGHDRPPEDPRYAAPPGLSEDLCTRASR